MGRFRGLCTDRHLAHPVIALPKDFGMELRFEDLSDIWQSSKQRKSTQSDAGNDRMGIGFGALTAIERSRIGKPLR
ncbi:MAG: hypothetical protein HC895_27440 [Leptolyngbyaceae cyanobacterium SM1_3_5]|nr:hypothetical protein [Leptolyngbyaceae cyanobacterium SM1_3_5]